MQWFTYLKLSNRFIINLNSDGSPNTLSLLSVTSHSMLLDVPVTSKTLKPLTDQGTHTKSSQEDGSTPSIIKTIGNNVNYIL